jgi:hypothetical protein
MIKRIIGAVLLLWCIGIVAGCETTNQDLFSQTSRRVVDSQPKI